MVHLNRTSYGFTVATHSSSSKDHENLSSTTKQTFSRRAGAIKNMRAQMKEWNSVGWIYFQDNTIKEPRAFKLTMTEIIPVEPKIFEPVKAKKKSYKKIR